MLMYTILFLKQYSYVFIPVPVLLYGIKVYTYVTLVLCCD